MHPGDGEPLITAPPRARLQLAIGAVVVLLLAGLAGAVVAGIASPRGGVITVPGPTSTAEEDVLTVVVHVLGAVGAPGLYRLREGARVVDGIAAAGGFTAEAARGALNLARVLGDAEQLVVPLIGEVPEAAAAPGIASDGRVNLNTADQAALESLPRVGPAMAQRIIDWRERNGAFQTPEDLLQVTGIGEKTLEAMRELVSV
ncbi:MAG TPA: helix-hairpin-helix domain-containing protein [Microbacteriaceae bacterium]|nr:helix-hairpin-helix domain-containing protein [Microbacteriaceae bacterium]